MEDFRVFGRLGKREEGLKDLRITDRLLFTAEVSMAPVRLSSRRFRSRPVEIGFGETCFA